MLKQLFSLIVILSLCVCHQGFAQKTKLKSTTTKPTVPLAELDPSTLKYEVGERCEIESKGKWYGGIIEKVNSDGTYHVSWDGYADHYNTDVEKNQLRPYPAIENVPYIVVKRDAGPVKVVGNLKDGQKIDLKWAENSSVACFPGTRFNEFLGNHKFYWLDLPRNSQVFIKVKAPNDERINVYAFSGFDGETLPPDVVRCVSCEAGYESWNPTNPPTDFTVASGPQKVQLRAVNNPYRVLVAVAGADGVTEGRYRLRIEIKPYP